MQPLVDPAAASRVVIAGGGIAGMAAGLALARAGWQPVIYEQAAAFSEVGAGVQLGPNVTRILRDWGVLDALLQTACQPRHLNARLADTGEVLARMDLHALGQRYAAPYLSVHRADLHRVLQQAALVAGVQIELGATVQGFTQTSHGVQALVSEQGATARSDVSQPMPAPTHKLPATHDSAWGVVADGVWSRLRQAVLSDMPPQWTGHLAYRALMPMKDLPAAVRQHMDTTDITVWMGAYMHLVCYPVSSGTHLNVVCLVEADMPAHQCEHPSWSDHKSEADTQHDLQRALQGACPVLRHLVEAGQGWRLWPLFGRTPMPGPQALAQGRIALMGDAAHPMLPYLAQGAGMAIEDAAALARCVPIEHDATVAAGLQNFANQRWRRNARVQSQAQRNGEIFHARGWIRWGRDVGLRLMGERLMDNAWLYGV